MRHDYNNSGRRSGIGETLVVSCQENAWRRLWTSIQQHPSSCGRAVMGQKRVIFYFGITPAGCNQKMPRAQYCRWMVCLFTYASASTVRYSQKLVDQMLAPV